MNAKKILILLLFFAMLVLAGCIQQTTQELGGCLAKCQKVCETVKEKNLDLNGFTNIQLTKATGSMTLSCSCNCQ